MWKNEKLSLTEKIFRETNCLVLSLLKTLPSRNFCQTSVRENFRNFHTVHHDVYKCAGIETVQKCLSHSAKKRGKVYLMEFLLKNRESKIQSFPHCAEFSTQ